MDAFLATTRQNIRPRPDLAYVSGGFAADQLSRTGYLARIHLHVSGTMTITPGTGTATLSEEGPWNLLRRIRFQVNQGAEAVNISGFAAYLLDIITKLGFEHEDGQVSAPFGASIYAAGVASGANAWEFGLTIPIVPNERDMAGLILLQTAAGSAQLLIEFAAAGGASSQDFPVVLTGNATASFAGNVKVAVETFTPPALGAQQPPITTLHQLAEVSAPVAQVGENTILHLRGNVYATIIHIVRLNGALNTNDVDRMRLTFNGAESPYDLPKWLMLQKQRRDYTRDLPRGVFLFDLFNQGFPGYGGGRDFIDSQRVAELASIVSIASGATLGSGNNSIRTITRQFVNLGDPAAA